MYELVSMNIARPDVIYKNKELREAAKSIYQLYTKVKNEHDTAQAKLTASVDNATREIAKTLATVKAHEAYKEDGFKSVEDFAEKAFGLSHTNAYNLAYAGGIYLDESRSETMRSMTPSNLAEVKSLPVETIEQAITDGKITAESTQKALRDFRAANTPANPKVLKQYYRVYINPASGLPEVNRDAVYTEADFEPATPADEWAKLPVLDYNGHKFYRKVHIYNYNAELVIYTEVPKSEVKPRKSGKKASSAKMLEALKTRMLEHGFTAEQIEDMIIGVE